MKKFIHDIFQNFEYLKIADFENTGLVKHCFTTRTGGVSQGECTSLNLGFNRNDKKQNVINNYKIVCNALDIDYSKLVLSNQVHGTHIKDITAEDAGKGIIKQNDLKGTDGLITSDKNVPLVTFYADCVPIFFLDPVQKVIGLVHSGWRGTLKKIGKIMVDKMVNEYDCSTINILCGIGPSIGPCHFEVGEEVYNKFIKTFGESEKLYEKKGEKYYINLWKANEIVLINSGIMRENITIAGECTFCNEKLFFSHRRDKGKTGSLAAVLQLI